MPKFIFMLFLASASFIYFLKFLIVMKFDEGSDHKSVIYLYMLWSLVITTSYNHLIFGILRTVAPCLQFICLLAWLISSAWHYWNYNFR